MPRKTAYPAADRAASQSFNEAAARCRGKPAAVAVAPGSAVPLQ